MKQKIKWFAVAVLVVGIVIAAPFLYKTFSCPTENGEMGEGTSATVAPDIIVTDRDGREVRLSDFRGRPVVLNFWATWCYYCRVEMGDFNTAYREYPDVVFLMINATDGVRETVWTAHEYIRGEGYEFPVYFDTEGTALSKYGVTGLPTTVFIDKEGNIVSRANGMLDLETLKQEIERITEE